MKKKQTSLGESSLIFFTTFTLLLLSSSLFAAEVRVAHLSPDAPAVDVLVGTNDTTKDAVLTNVSSLRFLTI